MTLDPAAANETETVEGLEVEVARLRVRVVALEKVVDALRSVSSDSGDVIVLRTISRERARQEIRDLFEAGETHYYSDIAERLRIDLPTVVEICNELIEEGDIEIDAEHSV
jgi:DNA-binding Lrp family transcriptional regulator